MIKYCSLILFFFLSQLLPAQTAPREKLKKNSIYLEFLGSAPLLYNLSYDRLWTSEGKLRFSTAIGLQYIFDTEIDGALKSDFSISPQVNLLYGKKHNLEIGIGAALPFGPNDIVFPLRIGYRFQKSEGGFFFKAAFTPIYFPGSNSLGMLFLPWAGVAAGYSF
ncbi:hypothetical protein [Croceimicrobium hydrocarbonivorans]|uniref:Secreted protein n=1 Tax=Croceimicrobium hydrocarbonivorans TaxID=2761580 RepID=A0A7H0VHG6_9FLAO|nr:hypothetical protein [Croceimicrobium hydrocarbonivorans]QNR25164.1 hypothetical protein H4K34_04815 [Croceimicrobium hydrocarbonivorans]